MRLRTTTIWARAGSTSRPSASRGQLKLYVDGKLVAKSICRSIRPNTTSPPIGRCESASARPITFAGKIADVRIYNRELRDSRNCCTRQKVAPWPLAC